MGQMFDLSHLRRRIRDYADRRANQLLPWLPSLHPGVGRLLVEIYVAANQKAPLTIGFPSHVLDDYFPALCYKADTVPASEAH